MARLASPHAARLALLDAFAGYVSTLLVHGGRCHRRRFHTYFVTHLPSSSLHPDARILADKLRGPAHVPAAAVPSTGPTVPRLVPTVSTASTVLAGVLGAPPALAPEPASAPASVAALPYAPRDTVVRIPLRSAKHHFGAATARGQRPYNEDTYQAGTLDMPAFAKRAPVSLVRSAVADSRSRGEAITAAGTAGDPQIFYFGIFDGHGGLTCSEFLREELHGYMETAAADFGMGSSLRKDAAAVAARGSVAAARLQRDLLDAYRNMIGGYFRRFRPTAFALQDRSPAGNVSTENVAPVGAVAAASSPSAATATAATAAASTSEPPAPASASVESVLTYAFLRADLDFVSAQARRPDPDDPCIADAPLNGDEVLGSPYQHAPPSGHGIGGGPLRFKGGSTASIALISTPTPAPFWHPAARAGLLVAHVGDTRVLLCETASGRARPLTRDHHPSSPPEARRLTRFATSLMTDSFGEERIAGLANSRAFGDMQSKRIGVSAEPELTRVDMGPAQYAFLVLVSDGVSGTLGDQEIVDIVKEARTPDQASRAVVDYATEVSRDGDNATCLVVRLGGWERRSEGGVGSLGTKEIRDARLAEALDPRRGRQ